MREVTTEGVLALVRDLVEAESPSGVAEAVNRAQDRVAAHLSALGARVERRPLPGQGDLLLARVEGEEPGPGLLLLAHADTVHPLGTLAGALPFRVEGERAHGPGTYDMKGGLALALAALAHLAARGRRPRLPVSVMVTPDEEQGSPASRPLIEAEALAHRAVLVVEPSGEGGRLTVARHGVARWRLVVTGRPAHAGAYRFEGRSAVSAAPPTPRRRPSRPSTTTPPASRAASASRSRASGWPAAARTATSPGPWGCRPWTGSGWSGTGRTRRRSTSSSPASCPGRSSSRGCSRRWGSRGPCPP